MTLLRRTATALFGLAILLLLLVQLFPFAEKLQLLGTEPRFSYAVLMVLALAALGAVLNLGHRPRLAGAAGFFGTALAGVLVLSMGGLRGGGAVALGFGMYLGAAGAMAAAALMALGSAVEERRHGPLPLVPRTFRAGPPGEPVSGMAAPAASSSPPAPRPAGSTVSRSPATGLTSQSPQAPKARVAKPFDAQAAKPLPQNSRPKPAPSMPSKPEGGPDVPPRAPKPPP